MPVTQVLTSTAFFPTILGPLITLGAYSVVRLVSHESSLSVAKAVASLSILNLTTTPARQLLFAIPLGLQAVGSFERIQKFLQLEDMPILIPTSSPNDPEEGQIEEESAEPDSKLPFQGQRPAPAIDICFTRASFTAITGPIGCGKSTLLRGLLSETASAQDISRVSSPDIAYCGQTPWIHDGTIRDNIVGASALDALWYKDVIRSCQLDFDLSHMPEGDATVVGSGGQRLSGGQRQRIVSRVS